MFDAADLKHKEQLPSYALRLIDGLAGVLARLDATKVGATSSFEIRRERREWVLELQIDPVDPNIPFLWLRASETQCTLGFADGEQIECHSDPNAAQGLVPMVLEAITAYLEGITIVEHYNNDRVVKKEYFFGIEGKSQTIRRCGVSTYFLFPKTITSSKTRVYQFVR
jgi:hypothetical protein